MIQYWLIPQLRSKHLQIKGVDFLELSDIACGVFATDKKKVMAKNRHIEVVDCRNAIVYLLRKEFRWPFQRIANLFGRDHSTIIHAVRIAQNRIDTEPDYRFKVNTIRHQIF